MPGIKKLQRIQWAKEVTPGTAVTTATTLWRGMGAMMDDQRVIEMIEEMAGFFNGADRSVTTKLMAGMSLAETPATPQQFPYLLDMSYGSVTPTADGTGTDKIFTYNLPTTAFPALSSRTVQAGDQFEAEQMAYAVCNKWALKGEINGTPKMSGDLFGRQVAYQGAFNPTTPPIPPVKDMATNNAKVYLDAITGAYGTTQLSNQIVGCNIEVENKFALQFAMTGQLFYVQPIYTGQDIKISLTFLHDTAVSGSGGAKADWRSETPKLLRVDYVGAALTTPGTTYSNEHIIVDLPFKYTKAGVIGEKDGFDVVQMDAVSKYNITAGNGGKVIVVADALAALP